MADQPPERRWRCGIEVYLPLSSDVRNDGAISIVRDDSGTLGERRSDKTELGPRSRLVRRYWLASRHCDSDVPMSTTLPCLCSPSCESHQSFIQHATILPSFPCYYKAVASRAIAHQVEHFLSSDSFEPSTHPSIHQSTHSSIHPPISSPSSHPSIRPRLIRTSSTYLSLATYQSHHITRGAASCQPKHPLDRNPIALVIYTRCCRVWRATSRDTPPS